MKGEAAKKVIIKTEANIYTPILDEMAEKESAGRDDWVQPESPIVENGCENNEIQ